MVSRVSGIVDIRPVRLGLVFEPDLELVQRAALLATSAWGGAYFPWLDPGEQRIALDRTEALATDVLCAIDDRADSEELARKPGFAWRGYQGPFDSADSMLHERLLGPEWLLDGSLLQLVLPQWEENDPLSRLFAVWFGRLADDAGPEGLRELFAARADLVRLEPEQDLPLLSTWTTPIQLTMMGIRAQGIPKSVGFAVIDPTNAEDLVLFWNLRAQGFRVFPWPVGHGQRLVPAALDWLQVMRSSADVPRARSASGQLKDPEITFWSNVEAEEAEVPEDLKGMIGGWEVHVSGSWDLPWGWTGVHPLSTDFMRFYDLTLPKGEWAVDVPLPRDRPGGRRLDGPAEGTVAVDITVSSESGLPAGLTFSVPQVRRLSGVIGPFPSPSESFRRPSADGQAVGVTVNSDDVALRLTSALAVFQELLSNGDWQVGQSDNGRFASRLIQLLGGAESQAANQPAIRFVLDDAARSPVGQPLARLGQTARDHAGEWPNRMQSALGRDRDYPDGIVRHLLARKVLRPFLLLKCPSCSVPASVAPEDLATEFQCEMCSERAPLGLVLALRNHAKWVYRLAGNVPEQRLRETLPMMAAVSLLSSWRTTQPASVPHVLGLEVRNSRQAVEVDFALALSDERPVVVLGEAKSRRDSIEPSDMTNLGEVQKSLVDDSIAALLCVATLREALEPDELAAIRGWCERGTWLSARTRERVPNLPIVLTGSELSVPTDNDGHPLRWSNAPRSIWGLAMESCRRNLGLVNVEWAGGPQDGYVLRWS